MKDINTIKKELEKQYLYRLQLQSPFLHTLNLFKPFHILACNCDLIGS